MAIPARWMGLVMVAAMAACASSPPSAESAAGTDQPVATASSDGIPDGRGWYCADHCGRSQRACDRAEQSRPPGDLEAEHRRLAAPACRPATTAYCMTYQYTLADVTPLSTDAPGTTPGPSPHTDHSPRQGHECLASLARCEETADSRARHGYQIESRCRPRP